jgi:hypothetical protein
MALKPYRPPPPGATAAPAQAAPNPIAAAIAARAAKLRAPIILRTNPKIDLSFSGLRG